MITNTSRLKSIAEGRQGILHDKDCEEIKKAAFTIDTQTQVIFKLRDALNRIDRINSADGLVECQKIARRALYGRE